MSSDTDETQAMSFEARLERLEAIVAELETGDRPLEQSLRLFEEGTDLSRRLSGILDDAERKIEILVKSSSGKDRLEPLQPEPS